MVYFSFLSLAKHISAQISTRDKDSKPLEGGIVDSGVRYLESVNSQFGTIDIASRSDHKRCSNPVELYRNCNVTVLLFKISF